MLLILLGLVSGVGADAAGLKAEGVVAIVGKTSLYRIEIVCRKGIERAYGNTGTNNGAVLVALINDAIECEVSSLNGVTVSPAEISEFSRYVDENTKAPEILEEIKKVFGIYRVSYERLYLRPRMINRKLHAFYSRSTEIHKKERALIERAYRLVHGGMPFAKAAEKLGLKASVIEVEDKEHAVADALQKYMPKPEVGMKDPLIAILETLPAGELHRYIIESDADYRVIRLAGKKDKTYLVEAIAAAKRPFDDWFREQAGKIKISIRDPELLAGIKKTYPELWWMKGLGN
ncbi:MAG: hypothetical protein M0Z71_15090 [Nitrospiraceae bacterium]|nr:hypothetical protein [Nitrospiraceae bacterium]